MAERKRKGKQSKEEKLAECFPSMLIVTVGGTPDHPYFTLHKDGADNINQDTIVGVYKFKRVSFVKVTRTLQRKKE